MSSPERTQDTTLHVTKRRGNPRKAKLVKHVTMRIENFETIYQAACIRRLRPATYMRDAIERDARRVVARDRTRRGA